MREAAAAICDHVFTPNRCTHADALTRRRDRPSLCASLLLLHMRFSPIDAPVPMVALESRPLWRARIPPQARRFAVKRIPSKHTRHCPCPPWGRIPSQTSPGGKSGGGSRPSLARLATANCASKAPARHAMPRRARISSGDTLADALPHSRNRRGSSEPDTMKLTPSTATRLSSHTIPSTTSLK